MKSDRLLETMENIDDKFITEAKTAGISRVKPWMKYGVTAAAVVLAVGVTYLFTDKDGSSSAKYPVKDVVITETTGSELYMELPWEDLSISQQYPEFSYNNGNYITRNTKADSETVGDYISDITVAGYDPIEDKTYTKECAIYQIDGINPDCGILVELESGEYYNYINYSYVPETLEQFMQDINWENTVEYGTADYHIYEGNESKLVMFDDIDTDRIKNLLESNKTLATLSSDTTIIEGEQLSISINIPALGYSNIGIWISENGYLGTNILDTGKDYYIGADAAKDFIDYVLNECTGYEVNYVNETTVNE